MSFLFLCDLYLHSPKPTIGTQDLSTGEENQNNTLLAHASDRSHFTARKTACWRWWWRDDRSTHPQNDGRSSSSHCLPGRNTTSLPNIGLRTPMDEGRSNASHGLPNRSTTYSPNTGLDTPMNGGRSNLRTTCLIEALRLYLIFGYVE